jgi:hypothetical protein
VDVGVDFLGAIRCLQHVAGYFLRRGALLLDRGGDLARYFVDLGNRAADDLDGVDGFARCVLDILYLRGDFLRRLGGLIGQRLYFTRHHGEAPAMLARARRLDRGVQGEQVGLARDILDQRHHLTDLLRTRRKSLDHGIGAARFIRGLGRDFRRTGHLLSDAVDRRGEFFRGGCDRLDIGRSLVRGGRSGSRLACRFRIAAAHGR